MRSLAGNTPPISHWPPDRRRPRRPVRTARGFAFGTLFVIAGVVIPMLVLGERSLLVRAELATLIVAGLLWLFLFIGLYRGARIRKTEPIPQHAPLGIGDATSDFGNIDGINLVDGVDDVLGAIVGFFVWIVLAVVLICFLPLLLEGIAYVVFVMFASLVWIGRRALRQVFAFGPRCRGKPGAAAIRATAFTALYSSWLFVLLWSTHLATHR